MIEVPTANKQAFIDHARHFDARVLELGAIRVIETWATTYPTAISPTFTWHPITLESPMRTTAKVDLMIAAGP